MLNSTETFHQPLTVVVPLLTSCVIAVILNIIVCCLILKVRSLKTATNIFILSLCLCNIVIAGILLPTHCFFRGSLFYNYLLSVTILAYICNLTAVTSERLFSITYPLKYMMIITKKKTTIIAVSAWTVSLVYALLPLVWNSDINMVYHKVYVIFTLVVFLIAPLIFVCTTYIKVCLEIKKMLDYNKECIGSNILQFSSSVENIASEMTCVPEIENEIVLSKNLLKPSDSSVSAVKTSDSSANNCKKEIDIRSSLFKQLKSKMSELKSATAFGIVALTYMMNWIPVIILTTLEAIGRLDLIPIGLEEFSIFIMAISTLVDPFIYALFLKNFRKKIKLIIRRFKAENRNLLCFT
nr:5-hydroxytryptamine receptor 1E [Hydra vulgaris]XP_047126173.1 5-hydroxytryptamine receptor 1E [Hydra vulgaris]XP_047126174.1 5-hydroxytryptamine receptor 1E [Hydra vulgaris]